MKNYTLLLILFSLSLLSSAQGVSIFEQDGKWGARSAEGKILVKPKYDRVRIFEMGDKELFLITLNGESGLVNEKGKTILKRKNQGIYILGDKYLYTWIGTRGRIIDIDGKTVINGFQNIGISEFWQGHLRPFKKDGKWGFLDKYTLQEVIPFEYDELSQKTNHGLNSMVKNSEHILLNKYGTDVVGTVFEDTKTIPAGAIAKLNNKWGVIDTTGYESIPIVYDDYRYQAKGNYIFSRADGERIVSVKTGKYMSQLIFDAIAYSTEDFFSVKKDGKWGVLNSETMEEVLPTIYDSIDVPGYILPEIYTLKDGKWEVYNTASVKLTKAKYDTIINKPGYPTILVMQDEKYGLIDRWSYDALTPCEYDEVQLLGRYVYKVRQGDKWGVIFHRIILNDLVPHNLNIYITPIVYDEVSDIYNTGYPEFTQVRQGDKWGYLGLYHASIYNTTDIYVVPCIYDEADVPSKNGNKEMMVKKDDKWGIIDLQLRGKILVDFTFDTQEELKKAHPNKNISLY